MMRFRTFLHVVFLAAIAAQSVVAAAQDRKVLVTVNDRPITSFDVDARINLWKLLGRNIEGPGQRKAALNAIIDDIAKIEEAAKYKAEPVEKDIQERLKRVAKGLDTDENGLKDKLKKNGISISAIRQYVSAQIAFNRLLSGKYKEKVEVSPAEIDAKMAEIQATMNGRLAKIKSDPRMQAVTVYELLEVGFPLDSPDLMQARLAEAAQFVSRFKGCNSARAAASGIFNVKIGKKLEADSRKIPKPMRAAFAQVGTGRAIGPFRSKEGIQVWGYCGTRKISPQLPKVELPNRQQIENAVYNEKFDAVEKKYSGQFRKGVVIEYRDPAYAD